MALTDRQQMTVSLPEVGEPPLSWKHTPADNKPTRPDVTTALTAPELVDYNKWYDTKLWSDPYQPVLANAITAKTTYETYLAAWYAWKVADALARKSQWRATVADAQGANFVTVAQSSVSTGVGSDAPPEDVPHYP